MYYYYYRPRRRCVRVLGPSSAEYAGKYICPRYRDQYRESLIRTRAADALETQTGCRVSRHPTELPCLRRFVKLSEILITGSVAKTVDGCRLVTRQIRFDSVILPDSRPLCLCAFNTLRTKNLRTTRIPRVFLTRFH